MLYNPENGRRIKEPHNYITWVHSLLDFMENNATDEERKAGYDIADFLLKVDTKESVLIRMIAKNSHIETLISTLDLDVISIEKHS